ncbi:hypothetical protein CLU79DRAFT_778672, partial [Phycomyces nitens]
MMRAEMVSIASILVLFEVSNCSLLQSIAIGYSRTIQLYRDILWEADNGYCTIECQGCSSSSLVFDRIGLYKILYTGLASLI